MRKLPAIIKHVEAARGQVCSAPVTPRNPTGGVQSYLRTPYSWYTTVRESLPVQVASPLLDRFQRSGVSDETDAPREANEEEETEKMNRTT